MYPSKQSEETAQNNPHTRKNQNENVEMVPKISIACFWGACLVQPPPPPPPRHRLNAGGGNQIKGGDRNVFHRRELHTKVRWVKMLSFCIDIVSKCIIPCACVCVNQIESYDWPDQCTKLFILAILVTPHTKRKRVGKTIKKNFFFNECFDCVYPSSPFTPTDN